jgi:hypothetical protein
MDEEKKHRIVSVPQPIYEQVLKICAPYRGKNKIGKKVFENQKSPYNTIKTRVPIEVFVQVSKVISNYTSRVRVQQKIDNLKNKKDEIQ